MEVLSEHAAERLATTLQFPRDAVLGFLGEPNEARPYVLTVEVLDAVRPGQLGINSWLPDEVVNTYVLRLKQVHAAAVQRDDVVFLGASSFQAVEPGEAAIEGAPADFSTRFMDVQDTRGELRAASFDELRGKTVYAPLCILPDGGRHWALLVFHVPRHVGAAGARVEYLDSCRKAQLPQRVRDIVTLFRMAMHPSAVHVDNRQDAPQQQNGSDCGPFVCAVLRAHFLGLELGSVSQQDMEYWRAHVGNEVLAYVSNAGAGAAAGAAAAAGEVVAL